MELVYAWIENFNNLKRIGFNFSSNFNVKFNKNKILLERNDSFTLDYGDIDNISVIVGKNGAGKTSIVDALAQQRNKKTSLGEGSFLLYHLKDNIFCIEGYYPWGIENLTNIPAESKEVYTFIVKLDQEKNEFVFQKYAQSANNKHQIAHLNIRDSFSSNYKHRDFSNNYYGFDYLRLNVRQAKNIDKYKFISRLKSRDTKKFTDFKNDIFLIIDTNFSYGIFEDLSITAPNNSSAKNKYILETLKKYVLSLYNTLENEIEEKLKKDLVDIKNSINSLDPIDKNKLFGILKEEFKLLNKAYNSYDTMPYYSAIKDYIELVEKELTAEYFINNKIKITIESDLDDKIINLLKLIDETKAGDENFLNGNIVVKFDPLSMGEKIYINLFSEISSGINILKNNRKLNLETIIIMLDEPDKSMHPEWSRKLISNLVDFVSIFDEFNFQFIITTHSPFIISDLDQNDVIRIEADDRGDCKVLKNSNNTFAQNIHTLFKDDFFMDSTFGEFAKQSVEKIIEDLKKEKVTGEDFERITEISELIGEPVLKSYLKKLINNKSEEM
ncbi:AAA family ATPase [Halanaerobium congolense]|uniref:AAA ATPase domain-containing protein n=1 Tax=Halanaerobium congolense TaxID=54121 RepID=A0A1G6MQC1_9FIRM|nr:AAA family ATPase [Halanaerobium congolense]SDC57427.1 AAA ATPase domain-containing protein [Halanaerobium congolense]